MKANRETYTWKLYQTGNVRYWYDKRQRLWVIQLVDSRGNQIGDADYSATKKGRDFAIKQFQNLQ